MEMYRYRPRKNHHSTIINYISVLKRFNIHVRTLYTALYTPYVLLCDSNVLFERIKKICSLSVKVKFVK